MSDTILKNRSRFLFDLDGTLVDSAPAHAAAFRSVLADDWPRLAAEFRYDRVKGCTTRDVFLRIGVPPDWPGLDAAIERKQRAYLDQVDAGAVRTFPGAQELLSTLADAGVSCSLVTGASRRSSERLLARLGLRRFFDRLVCGDDVIRGKPDPTGYLLAIAASPAGPDACIAVEDALDGVRAAHEAGVPAIGVHDPALAAAADLYCTDLFDLQKRFLAS